MSEQIIVGVIIVCITALVTYFITSVSQKTSLKELMTEHTRNKLTEHSRDCKAVKRIEKMERAIIYIVVQLGGNPKDLGLLD